MCNLSRWFTLASAVTVSFVAAGCGSQSMSGPSSDLATSDAVVATVDNGKAITPACKWITDVKLGLAPGPKGIVNVRAEYVGFGTATDRCPGPSWASDPKGILKPYKDAFQVRVILDGLDTEAVTVTATAPNGVTGSLTIKLPVQATSTSASPACKSITGVDLTILPGRKGITLIRATYVGYGGVFERCPAPDWTSDPSGRLVVQKDPFKVGVRSPARSGVVVTATAPNGVLGQIKVGS